MIVAGLALAAALWASADGAPQGPRVEYRGPPSPEEAAARADQLIKASGAPTGFANLSHGRTTVVLHRASGLKCYDHARVRALDPAGDAVACDYPTGVDERTTVFVFRTAAAATDGAELHGLTGPTTPYAGPTAEQDLPPAWRKAPPHPAERVAALRDGAPVFTRVSSAKVGDWTVVERTTGPLARARSLDMQGEARMVFALLEVSGAPHPARR